MSNKIVRYTPDQLGYKDRGKMKWMGLMLSHHLDLLREIDKNDKNGDPISKEKMTEIDISEILQVAYLNSKPIILQADIIKNNNFYPDLECMVLGYHDDKIYFKLKDDRKVKCELHQIRHIEFMDPNEWFDK